MVTETVSSSTRTSDASLSHTAAAFAAARSSTCANEGARSPSKLCNDVTPASEIPQGTMAAKSRRSVDTLSANPCEVIQREMWTPMAATFPAGFQMPTRPATRSARTPKSAAVRMRTSSTLATYLRTSFRSGFRSRMG